MPGRVVPEVARLVARHLAVRRSAAVRPARYADLGHCKIASWARISGSDQFQHQIPEIPFQISTCPEIEQIFSNFHMSTAEYSCIFMHFLKNLRNSQGRSSTLSMKAARFCAVREKPLWRNRLYPFMEKIYFLQLLLCAVQQLRDIAADGG